MDDVSNFCYDHFYILDEAAEHLHIAQPSLSQQIKKLETELGLTLFHRSHGSVTLTPHGLHLIEKAEDIIRLRDDLLVKMQAGLGHKLSICNREIYLSPGF